MSTIFSILENPLMQLLLIAGSVVGLSWLSRHDEARRIAQGLAPRSFVTRILTGMGYITERQTPKEDPWVMAAKELGLDVEKVLKLRDMVK